ncbi:trypsin Inhibitor like cysteine rich domain protein [Necator americanus]|uniref:Trypsin Inhibitor like cysteine rich domain protein n=1 Tax=Necator americanus TaxID=51031 RepID=W2T6X9_NECAM|nr:trypsin Inhibitor like cysteine rich domain protein [Necator americanus]ETN77643.1 trypsin Inhibitor like cysteine rich domain protein [Necator americanus]
MEMEERFYYRKTFFLFRSLPAPAKFANALAARPALNDALQTSANVLRDTSAILEFAFLSMPSGLSFPSETYACPTPAPTPYPPIVVVPIYQSPPVYTCPVYQTYAQCVPCERACNTPYYLCYQYCVPGCTCQPGFVRDTTTNNCINSYYCPRYRTYNRKAIKVQNADINRN